MKKLLILFSLVPTLAMSGAFKNDTREVGRLTYDFYWKPSNY